MSAAPSHPLAGSHRVASIDAYRGLVLFLMIGEVFHFCSVAAAVPSCSFLSFLCHHQSHVAWVGCSLHDLIQPSFTFLVGVSLPFSIASRLERGSDVKRMFGHAVWRSVLLILLGVFLRSINRSQTYWTFEDTLTQIGLGYGVLFLIGLRPMRDQWLALGVILVGYWAAFALYPLPGPDFDYEAVGVSANWLQENGLTGWAAHWQKNSNLAWAFDTWWMNLFPRESPFTHNGGGYSTLSFIPTLGTMILGLVAGGWLKRTSPAGEKIKRLLAAGLCGLLLGWILNVTGICPSVKRIWTPAWTLYSGGWCFLFLAAFYWIMDVRGWKAWAFWLTVFGMNSIAAYCMDWLVLGFIRQALITHLAEGFFAMLGEAYAPFVQGLCVMFVIWLILYWMHRKKIYLKI